MINIHVPSPEQGLALPGNSSSFPKTHVQDGWDELPCGGAHLFSNDGECHHHHSAQEGYGSIRTIPEEGHKDDQGAGAPLLRKRLRDLGMFSLQKRRLWGDLIAAFQYLKGAYKKGGTQLFAQTGNDRTGGGMVLN